VPSSCHLRVHAVFSYCLQQPPFFPTSPSYYPIPKDGYPWLPALLWRAKTGLTTSKFSCRLNCQPNTTPSQFSFRLVKEFGWHEARLVLPCALGP